MFSIVKFISEDNEYCVFDGKVPTGQKVKVLLRKLDKEFLIDASDLAKSMGLESEHDMFGSDKGLDAMLEFNRMHQEQNDSFLAEIVALVNQVTQPELRNKILAKLYGYDDAK